MHKKSYEMAEWAFDKACEKGYDCLSSQDWDDFKDCLTVAEKAAKCEYYYKVIEAMESDHRMTAEMYKAHSAEYYREKDRDVSNTERARQTYHDNTTQENFELYAKELVTDLSEMWGTLDNAMRTTLKARLQALLAKMG